MKRFKKTILLLAVLMVMGRSLSAATYPIVEPDLLEEVKSRIPEIKKRLKEKIPEFKEKIKNYRPHDLAELSPAQRNYSYTVAPVYTLPYDIPRVDKTGKVVGILYPKGYTFNPLDYIPFDPPTLVVFNGEREEEVEWVKKNWLDKKNTMLIITAGSWYDLMDKKLQRPVFYLPEVMKERLKLKNTVSVIYRDKKQRNVFRIDVYAVKKKEKERR